MICVWMILAAALGQTTQPAVEVPVSSPLITVAAKDDRPASDVRQNRPARRTTVADRPPLARKSPTSRPADGMAGPARPMADIASLAEEMADIGTLTGDPIEVNATSTGEIIISANEHDLKILSAIIAMMDRQTPGMEQTVKIFPLQSAAATDIAKSVQSLWNEYKKPASGQILPEDRLTIIPDARANLLMVAAAKDHMAEVGMIINSLDVASPLGDMKFTPIQLKHIKAAEAEQTIKDMLSTLQKQRGVSKDLFNIQANARTNTLLISAPESDLAEIRELINLIDTPVLEETGGVVKVAFVPLKKAVARELADALNDMLATESDVAKAMQEQIRQLQVILAEDGKELPPVDLEKPIKVFAEPGTNSLIVASVEANLKPLIEVIHLLDALPVGEDMMIKIYPLKHADVESVREDLQGIFDDGADLSRVPGKEEVKGRTPKGVGSGLIYPVGLVSDERTNTLIVSGRPEQLLLVEQIVKAVDVEDHANRFPVRMVKLDHADVRRVREVVEKLADQREEMAEKFGELAADRERTLLIDDVRTNSLIVVANDENYGEIKELAEKLDGAEDEWLGQIRIINLDKTLAASDIADKIENLWERRAELRREGGLPEDKPVIVTDSRINSLIIASNQEDYEAISALVKQLQQQPRSPMMDIYQLRVQHNDVSKIRDVVEQLFEERLKNSLAKGEEEQPSDRVAILDDPMTSTLLIVSSRSNYDEIVGLVAKLDVLPPVDGVIRTFHVKNIDVTDAEEMIENMFDKGIWRGASGDKDLPESLTKVSIVSDVRSNMLIVSASPENYALIEKMLQEIDRLEAPLFQADARFFQIEHADPVNVADVLTQLLEGLQDSIGEQSDLLQFKVIPEFRSRRLIVVGSRYAMERVAELIPQIDRPQGEPSSTVKVYQLKEASATQLEQVMTQLFEDRASQDQRGEATPIAIIPDEASNSLVVTASQDDHAMVEHLLTLLDKNSTLAQQMDIIALAEAKAEQVADTLDDLLTEQQGEIEGGFAITPDERTNSLVVWASPDLMVNIREIVNKLDNNRPKAEMALRVFKLFNAQAEDLSELLTQFFEDAGASDGREAKQMIINFIAREDPDTGEALIESLVHQDITIAPDKNTNALLVMAPAANINMMQKLVEMLDNVEPDTSQIRVFELHNADADKMRTLLEELFESEGEDGTPRTIAIEGGMAPAGAGGGRGIELAFSIDERTNSLIVAGSPAYLQMVEGLVYRLDYQEMDERVARVVRLNHQKASDVAETLTTYFEEENKLIEEAAGEEAAVRQLRRQVTVIEATQGEERESNVLLVNYSPQMESQVIRMINELDQPTPQVMIQVLMAEVTLNNNFEFGMEFAMQDLLFSETATLNPNTGLPQGGDFDFVFGTDVGAVGSSGLGGMSFTVSGEDFSFLLRALQSEGRVELKSRPAIMVQDGYEANIEIGEDVPVVTDLSVTSGGVVTPAVDYENVGIKLRVVPIINPDGYINMEVEPEISALGSSSVSIGAGVTLPTYTKRTALTQVIVRDGETIVIGGLITEQMNNSDNKVPILGDIPLLGLLFKSTTKSTTKTELLIVLTPHICRVAEDSRDISIDMRDATGMMENIRKSSLMGSLQVKPDNEQESFGPDVSSPDEDELEQKTGPADEVELGPELEEYGPAASTIRVDHIEPALASREE